MANQKGILMVCLILALLIKTINTNENHGYCCCEFQGFDRMSRPILTISNHCGVCQDPKPELHYRLVSRVNEEFKIKCICNCIGNHYCIRPK